MRAEAGASDARAARGRGFWAAVVLAVALLVGGVLAVDPGRTRSFGWFAYQPLPSEAGLPYMFFPDQLWGLLLVALGALLLSGLVGYGLGSRRATTRRGRRPSAR